MPKHLLVDGTLPIPLYPGLERQLSVPRFCPQGIYPPSCRLRLGIGRCQVLPIAPSYERVLPYLVSLLRLYILKSHPTGCQEHPGQRAWQNPKPQNEQPLGVESPQSDISKAPF